jgi:hypothetical protein
MTVFDGAAGRAPAQEQFMTAQLRRSVVRLRRTIGAAIVLCGMALVLHGACQRLCLAWNASAAA